MRPTTPGTFDDTDTATRKTVEKMCELIRESCADPLVQKCAEYAKQHFALGSNDPAALAWGVFWYVKHSVKFRLDEGTMFQIGERDQQDLLISPAVLVRMKDPAEDCDGFTMLTAALLTCLGVPVVIATVATEADDPSRWSHVFLCAIVNGRVIPLDTSHGPAPGWMVPRSRIHRWQTWKLDGKPAEVKIPSYQGLHGYATARRGMGQVTLRGGRSVRLPLILVKRGRGFGQCTTDPDTGDEYCPDDGSTDTSGDLLNLPDTTAYTPAAASASALAAGTCYDNSTGLYAACPSGASPGAAVASSVCPSGYVLSSSGWGCVAANPSAAGPGLQFCGGSGQPACVPGTNTPPSSVSPNWAALAGQIVATAGQDVKAVIQQPQALLNAQTWANLSAYLPILGIGILGVIVLTTVIGSKK